MSLPRLHISLIISVAACDSKKGDNTTTEEIHYEDFESDSSQVTEISSREWTEMPAVPASEKDTLKAENCNLIRADTLFPHVRSLFGDTITSRKVFGWMRESEKNVYDAMLHAALQRGSHYFRIFENQDFVLIGFFEEDEGVYAYSLNKTNCEVKFERKIANESGWENGYKQSYSYLSNDSTLQFNMIYGAKDFGDYQIWKRGSFYKTLIFTKEGMIEEIEHVSEIIPIDELKEHFTFQDTLIFSKDSTLSLARQENYCPNPIKQEHLQDIYDMGLEKYLKKGNCFHSITQLRDGLTALTIVYHNRYDSPQIRLYVFDKTNQLKGQLDVYTTFIDGCCGNWTTSELISDTIIRRISVNHEGLDSLAHIDSIVTDYKINIEGLIQETSSEKFKRVQYY